jgi:uncharacterized repeat protein (TIGR03837 family)
MVMGWELTVDISPADLVIEAFGVNLPAEYIAKIAARDPHPVWINLEYLSAESWVAEHHLLPSPNTIYPLTKYFFFPGFTRGTGGLIRERNFLVERDRFIAADRPNCLRVLLFGYPNVAGDSLVAAIAGTQTDVQCTVPEGALAQTLKEHPAIEWVRFTPQQDFDHLLWDQDVLFVRGEDSFVRAQWAAKPFIWQIYPQFENAHWAKLNAFLDIYCIGLEREAESALRGLWHTWNAEEAANIGAAWRRFLQYLPAFNAHAIAWSKKLVEMPDLAANLLSFYQKNTKI